MKELIPEDEFADAAMMQDKKIAAKAIFSLSKLKKLNKMYSQLYRENADAFVNEVLNALDVEFSFNELELKNIPAKGPFITVSNLPFGVIEGLILIKMLGPLREDYKIMANFLVKHIEPVKDQFIMVNQFNRQKERHSNLKGIKTAIQWIGEGHGFGIFPAGEVSTFQADTRRIEDREWQPQAIKMIQNAKVPIIPIYFQGSNSMMYHLMGLVHKNFRTIRLPKETLKKKKDTIKVRIGRSISVREQAAFTDTQRFGRFLRAKTYSLGSALEVKKFYRPTQHFPTRPQPIVPPTPQDKLEAEVVACEEYFLVEQNNYRVYCAPSGAIPYILNEIGRQREITFREVGEGTNKSIDLDEYDLYYEHLFIWEKEEKRIIGAYRLGCGDRIMNQYGRRGFYTTTLFKIKKGLEPVLRQSVELGRSFVIKDHQNKLHPLFLLWRGLLVFAVKHPHYRYLFGPTSISNSYSEISKSLMVAFVRKHYWNEEYAQYVKPRNRYKIDITGVDTEPLLENAQDDFKKMDKIIADIEPGHFTLPILLKKYMKQNANIIGFNIDPKFNDALDGLMLLDMNLVPEDTINNLRKDFELVGADGDALLDDWLKIRKGKAE